MKIALLLRNFSTTGGAERYAVELTRHLAKHHEVHVFTQSIEAEAAEAHFHLLPRISIKPRYLNLLFFSRLTAKEVAKAGPFDVVHSHERCTHFDVLTTHCPTFICGLEARYGKPLPLLARLKIFFSIRIQAYLWLERHQFSVRPFRRWLPVTRHVMKDVLDHYPLPEDRFSLAYPGVDLARFSPLKKEERDELRKKEAYEKDSVVVLFIGTEFKRKGLGVLIKALALLKENNYHLLVLGGGPVDSYKKLCQQESVDHKVRFVGLVKDVPYYTRMADIFVLPTTADPGPMSPLEALSSGASVIVSNEKITGVAEHFVNGGALLLQDPRDPKELAEKLASLKSAESRKKLVEEGQRIVSALSWEATTQATLQAYEKIVEEKARAGAGSRVNL